MSPRREVALKPQPARDIVLVDIDGTLADVWHRLRHLRGPGRKDWKKFFAAMNADPPLKEMIAAVRELSREYEIVIFTGRPEEYRARTDVWLRRFDVPHTRLLMRPQGDHRPDYTVKREMIEEVGRERIALAIDDRPQVCAMLREAGVQVFEVASDERNQQVNELYRQRA